jgi:hypothetical protein
MIRHCRLHALAGQQQACPEAACAFWEPGGAVVEGRCAFEWHDFGARPELVQELLRIREQLELAAREGEDGAPQNASHQWSRLLNERAED